MLKAYHYFLGSKYILGWTGVSRGTKGRGGYLNPESGNNHIPYAPNQELVSSAQIIRGHKGGGW